VHYPQQKMGCPQCEGYKRVAILTGGPKLFKDYIGKPLPMTYAKAFENLTKYKDAGALTMIVRDLARHLDTVGCPWCKGTEVAILRQLTPEEAAEFREKSDLNTPG